MVRGSTPSVPEIDESAAPLFFGFSTMTRPAF
jgi:hypothetical protein